MAPGATYNARGASGRTWSRGHGGTEANPLKPSASPARADFGGTNGSSRSSNSNDSRDFPALARRPARDLEVFGKLPALQSGRTRSQSQGLTMRASYVDALLAYAMRAMEAKETIEEKAVEIEQAHDLLLEERLEKEHEWLEKLKRRGALLD